MTAYTEWLPGPTQAEQYNSFTDVYGAFLAAIVHERVGDIGGSVSLTWYITGGNHTEGANPEFSITWASTTGGHTATSHYRYNPVLLGTLDPSIPYAVDTGMPQGVLASMTYAQAATWISRVGGLTAWRGSVMLSLATACIGMAASIAGLTLTTTALSYTDGSRAGGTLGLRMAFSYNPSAAELTAGINQLEAVRVGIFSDGADGTVNVSGDGASLGTAQVNVPIVQFQSAAAEDAWFEFTQAELEAADFAGFTGANTVSHVDDLGEPDHPSTEPDPADARQLFDQASMLPVLVNTPGSWPALTGPGGAAFALIVTAGYALSTIISTGILSAMNAAYGAISGAITTSLQLVGSNTTDLVASSTTANENLANVKNSLDFLASNSASNALTSNLEDIKVAAEAIEQHLGTIVLHQASQVTNGAAQAGNLDRIADALEALVDLLDGDAGATPPVPGVLEVIQQAANSLQDVAELRNTLRIRAKGIEVEGTVGMYPDE